MKIAKEVTTNLPLMAKLGITRRVLGEVKVQVTFVLLLIL